MIRKRQWRGDEFEALASRYAIEGPRPLAIELNRTESSVVSQAWRLGVRSLTRRARQTETRRRLREMLAAVR